MRIFKTPSENPPMATSSDTLLERIKELESENVILKLQHIEITQAKELYLKIFEEFPALIWRARLDKLCDYFNKTWLDFTGRTLEQEFGNGWTEGLHPDDFDFCLQTFTTSFDKRVSFLMEYRMKNRFGEYRWIRDFGRPFYDLDNTFLGYIGSCYDITESKNSELTITLQNSELQKLNIEKDKFLSILAHDLRGPFNSMLGFTNMLDTDFPNLSPSEISIITRNLNTSAHKLYQLLENLLEWSLIQRVTPTNKPESYPISERIGEVIELIAIGADTKGVKMETSLEDDLMITADTQMFDSLIRNLVLNAVKFTNKGGKVMVAAKKTTGNSVLVSVSDTGIGMSTKTLDSLFQLDRPPGRSGTDGEPSSGLGLLLCKEYVEKTGGKIWAESEEGIGSSIYFTVPLTQPD
jgi:two-component system CheB/CheR fusion protein